MAKVSDLILDKHNANLGTERGREMLARSLREYGAGRSVLVDKEGRIIAGNKTVQQAIEAGIEDLLVVETDGTKLVAVKRLDLDLDDGDRARELAYADNRTSEIGLDWDADQLLADLESGLDLSGLFGKDELDELLKGLASEPLEDPGPQIDRAAELQAKWGTATGQIWQLDEHRLAVGDCTDRAVVEAVMESGKASLVVTDPPYGVKYADKNKFLNSIAKGNRIQIPIEGDHGDKQDIQEMWKNAFYEMEKVMDKGAVIYCFMPQGGDQMMMMMMMMGAGIEPRHELIWLKNNHVLGRVDYAYKHEPILYAWKDGGHNFYGGFQTSILEFPKPQKSGLHPTTKPIELIEKLIGNSSLANEVVYDPFVGSGITLIACERLNRRCRAIDIEPKYCAVTIQRWVDMTGGEPRLIES